MLLLLSTEVCPFAYRAKRLVFFIDTKESTRLGITQSLIIRWEELSRYVFPVDITHLDGSYLALFSYLLQLIPRTTLHSLNVEFLLASAGFSGV